MKIGEGRDGEGECDGESGESERERVTQSERERAKRERERMFMWKREAADEEKGWDDLPMEELLSPPPSLPVHLEPCFQASHFYKSFRFIQLFVDFQF